ncbi:MAG: hypothetical protein Q8Q50_10145 [Methylobacter sp.]|nr:hypothetical protein [Methylobacter sp.]
MLKYVLFFTLILPTVAIANGSLCKQNEVDLFFCQSAKKTVSLCASKNLSKTDGYLQYRFGSKRKIELNYPEQLEHPSNFFTYGSGFYSGGGSNSYLRFNINKFIYTIYTADGSVSKTRGPDNSFHWEESGIVVEKNDKIISNFICRRFTGWADKLDEILPIDNSGLRLPE